MQGWGACRNCNGTGELLSEIKDLILNRSAWVSHQCDACDGDGSSHNAMDEPFSKSAHNDAMQAAIQAANETKGKV